MKKKAESDYSKILNRIERKYGNKETNTDQLTKIGKKMFKMKFKGVFAADQIPLMKNKEYAIINLDDSDQGGSHWIAVIKEKNKVLIYDSFGRRTFKILPELIQSGNGVVLETENDAEQGDLEENCGQRCLVALKVYDKYGWKGLKYI